MISTRKMLQPSVVNLPRSPAEETQGDSAPRVGWAAVRVALFVTCFNDTLFPETGKATVRLLDRLGCEVDFPEDRTCCGVVGVA